MSSYTHGRAECILLRPSPIRTAERERPVLYGAGDQRGDVRRRGCDGSAASEVAAADALDFLGDAGNYIISCLVVGNALRYRVMASGTTMGLFGQRRIASLSPGRARARAFTMGAVARRSSPMLPCLAEGDSYAARRLNVWFALAALHARWHARACIASPIWRPRPARRLDRYRPLMVGVARPARASAGRMTSG